MALQMDYVAAINLFWEQFFGNCWMGGLVLLPIFFGKVPKPVFLSYFLVTLGDALMQRIPANGVHQAPRRNAACGQTGLAMWT
jgi:hypothetical protein